MQVICIKGWYPQQFLSLYTVLNILTCLILFYREIKCGAKLPNMIFTELCLCMSVGSLRSDDNFTKQDKQKPLTYLFLRLLFTFSWLNCWHVCLTIFLLFQTEVLLTVIKLKKKRKGMREIERSR